MMRATADHTSVRLYHVDRESEGGGATMLFYGPLSEALMLAGTQSEAVQDGLFIATDNDVIAYLDLITG